MELLVVPLLLADLRLIIPIDRGEWGCSRETCSTTTPLLPSSHSFVSSFFSRKEHPSNPSITHHSQPYINYFTPQTSFKNKMSSNKFSHRFSGLSIWIEPDPEQSSQLIEEMEFLRCKCGGIDAGLHRFVPHCTLLYNTSLDDNTRQQGESMLRSRQQSTKHHHHHHPTWCFN